MDEMLLKRSTETGSTGRYSNYVNHPEDIVVLKEGTLCEVIQEGERQQNKRAYRSRTPLDPCLYHAAINGNRKAYHEYGHAQETQVPGGVQKPVGGQGAPPPPQHPGAPLTPPPSPPKPRRSRSPTTVSVRSSTPP